MALARDLMAVQYEPRPVYEHDTVHRRIYRLVAEMCITVELMQRVVDCDFTASRRAKKVHRSPLHIACATRLHDAPSGRPDVRAARILREHDALIFDQA